MKKLVFLVFILAGMAFMAGIEGADMPKWVWIFIAVVAVIYAAAKNDIDKWFNKDNFETLLDRQPATADPKEQQINQDAPNHSRKAWGTARAVFCVAVVFIVFLSWAVLKKPAPPPAPDEVTPSAPTATETTPEAPASASVSIEKFMRTAFYYKLEKLVPRWEAINTDSNFLDWLRGYDDGSKYSRQELLKTAYDQSDAIEAAKYFKRFLLEQASQARAEVKKANKSLSLNMAKLPYQPKANEVPSDERFIANNNGTVLDLTTNLMWAAKDNGSAISWRDAKSYCENYRGGGYTDWRMPTQDELAGLYDAGKTHYKTDCGWGVHLTELIRLTCTWAWASETRGSEVADFNFFSGKRNWTHQSYDLDDRALPVRSVK